MSTFNFRAAFHSVEPERKFLQVEKQKTMSNFLKVMKYNMTTNQVAVCGMDVCFDLSRCGGCQREEVCEDYTMSNCEDFEIKKRKRDDADDTDEED